MATLNDLQNRMDRYGIQVKSRADEITRGAASTFLSAVAPATPYRTGKAISNWLVGSGSPRSAVVNPNADGAGKAANVAATIAKGNARIVGYRYGTNIYVTNNVEYIGVLNSGSSKQAAAGFIEGAMLTTSLYIQNQRIFRGN